MNENQIKKAANDAKWYADKYNCTLVEAIDDFDYPVTLAQKNAILAVLGKSPVSGHFISDESVLKVRSEFDREHDIVYG